MGGEHWRATLAPGAVEIPELRSRDAKHFQNQDGTRTAVIVPGMHWQDDDGTWQDVDLNLNYAPDAPDLLGRANDVHVRVNNFKVHVYDRRTGVGIRWSIPQRPAGAGRSAAFRQDGLDWRYVRTRTGVKLEGTAAARLGARTFVRHYVISTGFGLTDIDVNALLLEDGSGGVYGPGFACPAPIGRGSDGLTYSLGAFAVDGRRVVWAYDDTHVPGEAFPLTIDPTTSFSVPGSGDDGYVNRKSGVYPPGGTITTSTTAADLTVSRSFALSTYEIWVSVMRFDTSSLALAASISTAKLHLYGKSRTATDGRSLVLEWYDPSNWPISTAMYAETAPASPAGSVGLTVFLSTVDNAITLANADVNINQLGYTAVRAHISGGQPTGNNKVTIASWDDTTNAAPALEITYTPRVGLIGTTLAEFDQTGNLGVRIPLAGSASVTVDQTGALLKRIPMAGPAVLSVAPYAVLHKTVLIGTGRSEFSVSTGSDDGTVTGNGTSYPPLTGTDAETTATTLQVRRFWEGTGGSYELAVGVLRFNTAGLAGSVVTGATLRIVPTIVTKPDATATVAVEWYSGSLWPISTAMYTSEQNPTAAAIALSSITTTGIPMTLSLSSAATGVLTTGYTALRMVPGGKIPTTTTERFFVASVDNLTASNRPLLTVDYVTPQPAAVSVGGSGSLYAAPPLVQLAGAGAAAVSQAGDLGLRLPLSGPVAATVAQTGALLKRIPLAGSTAAIFAQTGALLKRIPLAGPAAATISPTGALTVKLPVQIAGAAAVAVGPAGALVVRLSLDGAGALAVAPAGAIGTRLPLDGSAAVAVSQAAGVSLRVPLMPYPFFFPGSSEGSFVSVSQAGSLRVGALLAGSATVTTDGAGSLTVKLPVQITGSGEITVSQTGAIAARVPLSGQGAIAVVQDGTAAVHLPLAGSASVSVDQSGALTVKLPVLMEGTSTVALEPAGALGILLSLAGEVAASVDQTGTIGVRLPLAGEAPVTVEQAGAVTSQVPLAGAATVGLAGEAVLLGSIPLFGTAGATVDAVGALAIVVPLAGSEVVTVAPAALLGVGVPFEGAVTVTVTEAGAVNNRVPLAGAASVSVDQTGAAALAVPLSGDAALALDSSAGLNIRVRALSLGGGSSLAVSSAGDLAQGVPLVGETAVALDVAGGLFLTGAWAGAAAVTVDLSGDLALAVPLAGDGPFAVDKEAALALGVQLAGETAGVLAQSGALGVRVALAGAVAFSVDQTGAIGVRLPLAGASDLAVALFGETAGAMTLGGGGGVTVGQIGALGVRLEITGAVAVAVEQTGAVDLRLPLAGTGDMPVSGAGAVALNVPLAGGAVVTMGHAADVQLPPRTLEGVSDLALAPVAGLSTRVIVAGAAPFRFRQDGAVGSRVPLDGGGLLVAIGVANLRVQPIIMAGGAGLAVIQASALLLIIHIEPTTVAMSMRAAGALIFRRDCDGMATGLPLTGGPLAAARSVDCDGMAPGLPLTGGPLTAARTVDCDEPGARRDLARTGFPIPE